MTRCVRRSNCYYGLDRPDATNFKKKPKFGVVTSPIWSISQHQSLVEPHIEGFGNPLATLNTTHTVWKFTENGSFEFFNFNIFQYLRSQCCKMRLFEAFFNTVFRIFKGIDCHIMMSSTTLSKTHRRFLICYDPKVQFKAVFFYYAWLLSLLGQGRDLGATLKKHLSEIKHLSSLKRRKIIFSFSEHVTQ